MKTGAAADPRRLAIDAIVRIDTKGAYANLLVPRLLERSGLSARDRALATELVYGSTRLRRRLDYVVDRYLRREPPPEARAALRIGAHQILHLRTPHHAAVAATVSAAPKRYRGLVNAVLRKLATAADQAAGIAGDAGAGTEGTVSGSRDAGDNGKAQIVCDAGGNERTGSDGESCPSAAQPPSSVVCTSAAAGPSADTHPVTTVFPSAAVELSCPDWMLARLEADLGAGPARAALEAMNLAAPVHRRDDGYTQDPSAALVAEAVPVSPGDLVADLCAAPGGKATALAQRGARVAAADRSLGRVGLITANKDRLGIDDLHAVNADLLQPPFRHGSFDAVLLDAPCSGLGVLRRRPDARWRIGEHRIAELAELQGRMLAAAAELVRPGGHLVYSVCTLTRAEAVGPLSSVPAGFEALGAPDGPWQHFEGAAYLLLPDEDHDGAAIARWRRCTSAG